MKRKAKKVGKNRDIGVIAVVIHQRMEQKVNTELDLFFIQEVSTKLHDEMPDGGQSFRTKTVVCLVCWVLSMGDDEVLKFVYIDSIYITEYILLIACTEKYDVGWRLASCENFNFEKS